MSRPSDPTKPAVWRERFERFSRSGLAVTRFCAGERVSMASFYHWRRKFGPKGRRLPAGRGHFQKVAVVPAVSGMIRAAPAVCIQLPCGTRMEVRAEDLDAVRTVVTEVARAGRAREAGVA